MKKIRYIIIVLILLSCSSERELNFEEEIDYFEEGFIDHFPKKIKFLGSLHSISQNISNSHPHVWLKFFPDKGKLDSVENAVKLKAIGKYFSEDTCLVVIDKHLNSKNWYKIDKTQRYPKKIEYGDHDCHKEKYPVPNFFDDWWMDTDQNMTKLKGYTMYVLEAKKGVYMNPKKLPNGLYTPSGWEHGISKGVAINKEKGAVIYWADIW
ncbi:hypothetical protein ACFOUP_08785 [Belliella kenyensis]|uniref:Uncharacterized protein n=1 Tax=Belliella kenyensis TaxID=1472724 RepID=A0ABV8EJK2_9BACT|nr:hypothetical protein [Belliella kenyensis]MCH7403892.1 hypothetical protein [Belliella kenyensis]MDN3604904.1 hypothetical protein [Belliella kenyensis]